MLRTRAAGVVLALVALAIALLAAAAPVRAQERALERPELPELVLAPCPGADTIRVEAGVVTMPRATGDCMLGRLRGLPPILRYLSVLEEELRVAGDLSAVRDRDEALSARELELTRRAAEVAREALEVAERRARAAEEELDAWYRHPALWTAVGVVVAIALEVAAVAVLQEVTP